MAIEIAGYGLNEELPLVGVSIWDILLAVIVLVVGAIVVRLVVSMLQRWMTRAKLSELLIEFTTRILRIIMYIFVVGIALSFMGLHMGAALVSISVVLGFVLGFALGDTLGNIAAGFMVAITQPFKAGDYVTVNGESGSVQSVGISVTELDTPDNKRVIIPNKLVWGGNIVNYTRHDTRRVDMEIGVDYEDDLDHVIETTRKLLTDDERVLSDPAPQVAVSSLGDSAVVLVVRPWVKTADYWSFFFDFQKTVKQTFDGADISFPYPQMDVHLDK
ncbi:MAG: mechanosensitive ion channel [Thermoplasmatota archaeon]